MNESLVLGVEVNADVRDLIMRLKLLGAEEVWVGPDADPLVEVQGQPKMKIGRGEWVFMRLRDAALGHCDVDPGKVGKVG